MRSYLEPNPDADSEICWQRSRDERFRNDLSFKFWPSSPWPHRFVLPDQTFLRRRSKQQIDRQSPLFALSGRGIHDAESLPMVDVETSTSFQPNTARPVTVREPGRKSSSTYNQAQVSRESVNQLRHSPEHCQDRYSQSGTGKFGRKSLIERTEGYGISNRAAQSQSHKESWPKREEETRNKKAPTPIQQSPPSPLVAHHLFPNRTLFPNPRRPFPTLRFRQSQNTPTFRPLTP